MSSSVCPFWLGYLLAFPARRLVHNPDAILQPHVKEGMLVLDVGPAMGFFTLPLARMVGPSGKVICVDVQEKMIENLRKRAGASGLADRIVARTCQPTSLGIDDQTGKIDFALAFAVVHEIPDKPRLIAEVTCALRPGGRWLVAEPKGHVKLAAFNHMLTVADAAGLGIVGRPRIHWCHAALLEKRAARSH